jgi:hypothetical protein
VQWRYAVGEDREALTKVDRTETEEDKAAKEKVHIVEGADGTKLKLKVRAGGWQEGAGQETHAATYRLQQQARQGVAVVRGGQLLDTCLAGTSSCNVPQSATL